MRSAVGMPTTSSPARRQTSAGSSRAQEQLDWFEREQDNLRAALDRLHEADAEPELEARLVVTCAKFWSHRGLWSEARRRQDAALERAEGAPPPLRGRLLWEAAELLWSQGDHRRGKDLAEAGIALLDQLGTRRWTRSPPATCWPLWSTTLAT
jgi:hypothetical protein